MRTGAGLALICVGAILAFAVTVNLSFLNVHTAGWILMLVGLIGMFVPRGAYGWLGRRMFVRRTRAWPGSRRAGTVVVPAYTARNPDASRIEAGMPTTPTPANLTVTDPRPEDTEVIEDIYEQ